MTDHGYIDVSAWTGTWPFDVNGHVSLARLAARLEAAGILEALVSPLDAVLAPDPMPANRALLAEIEEAGDLPVDLRPAPVVNPLLATWFADLVELLHALGREHLGQQVARRVEGQELAVDRHALAVDAQQRRRVGREVEVGRLLLAHQAQDPLHGAAGRRRGGGGGRRQGAAHGGVPVGRGRGRPARVSRAAGR